MNFIPYIDLEGHEHFFDASRVMFTMSQVTSPTDQEKWLPRVVTKVALNENMGFIIANEPAASMVSRIKEANGIAE